MLRQDPGILEMEDRLARCILIYQPHFNRHFSDISTQNARERTRSTRVAAPSPSLRAFAARTPGKCASCSGLATNLGNEPAQSIVQIYARRMQIEECFRDAKCFPASHWPR